MTALIEDGPLRPWQLFRSLLEPHRRALFTLGTALAVATVLPLAGPLILRAFIDRAASHASVRPLVVLAGVYAVLGLAATVAQLVVVWRASSLTWRITNGLRRELTDHVLSADLSFFRDNTTGELISRLDDDVTAMNDFIAKFVVRLISVALLSVASIAVVAIVQPILAIPLAVFVAAMARMVWRRRDAAIEEATAERAATADVMGFVEEAMAGAPDLSTLAAGPFAVRRLAQRSERLVQAAGRRGAAQMATTGAVRVGLSVGEMSMLAIGAAVYGRGWVTLGTVFLGYRFVGIIESPAEMLAWQLQELQGAGGAAHRVLALLAERAQVRRGTAPLPAGPLGLVLDDVSLAYAADEGEVLSSITLAVPPGRRLGLIGRSGSGKTSLARLVLGLVEPTRGTIRLGGVALGQVDEASLRRRVAAVPQDVQLFPGSVRDNVTLFDPAVGDEAVATALRTVGLSDWVTGLPAGLASALTIGATEGADADPSSTRPATAGMSAGEAQLLALARVFLRSPDVVVLDEATSRVDPETQARLQAATTELLHGRAAIVIAHRLETLETCDDIAVLEDGRLVEFGERSALASSPTSRYARLLAAAGGGADGVSTEAVLEELS